MHTRIDISDNFSTPLVLSTRRLALLGGQPMFVDPLHVGRPNIVDEPAIFERIADVFRRRWLTNDGIYVRQLEELIANRVRVRHCVATCNATSALQLLAHALGWGGEVIVPSLTFIATAHALRWLGIRPVFADVNPDDWTLNAQDVAGCINAKTSAIMGVHLFGQMCDVTALQQVASDHSLSLAYDASHALACGCRGASAGMFGAAEVFSFHATKFANSAEGGAIVTNDDALAEALRQMRNFGFGETGQSATLGINAKMSELNAVVGISSLEHLDEIIAANVKNFAAYEEGLGGHPAFRLRRMNSGFEWNHQYVIVEVIEEFARGVKRDHLVQALRAENVLARRYFYPGCHRQEPYASENAHVSLPVTEQIVSRVIALPTGMSVSTDDVTKICWILRQCIEQAQGIVTAHAACI